jgi:hypothetical protein
MPLPPPLLLQSPRDKPGRGRGPPGSPRKLPLPAAPGHFAFWLGGTWNRGRPTRARGTLPPLTQAKRGLSTRYRERAATSAPTEAAVPTATAAAATAVAAATAGAGATATANSAPAGGPRANPPCGVGGSRRCARCGVGALLIGNNNTHGLGRKFEPQQRQQRRRWRRLDSDGGGGGSNAHTRPRLVAPKLTDRAASVHALRARFFVCGQRHGLTRCTKSTPNVASFVSNLTNATFFRLQGAIMSD